MNILILLLLKLKLCFYRDYVHILIRLISNLSLLIELGDRLDFVSGDELRPIWPMDDGKDEAEYEEIKVTDTKTKSYMILEYCI